MSVPAHLRPIGHVESPLTDPALAPKQGSEGAPDAWLVLDPDLAEGFVDLEVGTDVVVLTWLHRAQRDVLSVHPRGDQDQPRRGVFSTRSPHRPNPIGLHPVRVLEVDGNRVLVDGLEAVDGTPVVDIKPASTTLRRIAPPPRTARQRRHDTLQRLRYDIDAWVATAHPATGTPYMVPLSFLWDGEAMYVATPATSPTAHNLSTSKGARVAIGSTRDVVLIEATATTIPSGDIDDDLANRFTDTTGFDPRTQDPPYPFFRLHPQRIQAWREANELAGRELMADGQWLAP